VPIFSPHSPPFLIKLLTGFGIKLDSKHVDNPPINGEKLVQKEKVLRIDF
jgi:hypothetical protein